MDLVIMHYLVAFQILCGFFAAYVAVRKERSGLRWWCVGALLPAVGVALALMVDSASGSGPGDDTSGGPQEPLRRPRRCSGQFIPDCLGCAHFRRRLFGSEADEMVRGYCEFYARELCDEEHSAASD
ncbi:MAG: hypothetical protein R6V05_01985 [Candidatus Brocadiia bacterium]